MRLNLTAQTLKSAGQDFKVSRAGFLMVLLILSALYSEEF
jgi:hypothetical protein